MFKKNIAKLLVFAMILSMLPFSAVTAGAARTTRNTASNDGYALIKDSTAYVTGKDASAKLKLTAPDNNKGAGTTTSPYVLMNDSGYVVVKDTDNRKTVNVSFEVENADSVYYLGTDAITSLADADKASLSGGKSVNQEITITASLSATTGTPVTAFFAAYSLEKDATYYKLTFSARAEDVKSDEYTVTFDAQGGNFASGVSNTAKANKANNYKVTLPTAPTKDNAKFEGWFTQPEGNGEPFTAEYTVTSDMTVYANWSLKTVTNEYKVNVDTMEHGTVTPNPTTAVEGAAVTLTVEPEQTYRLKADTLLVYKVAKDTLNISDTTPIKPTYSDNAYTFTMPDSDVIITAEFAPAAKQITEVNLEMSVVFSSLKQGFALPKVSTETEGVAQIQIKWFKNTVEVTEAFSEDGDYTYEIIVTPEDGYALAENVIYKLDGAEIPQTDTVTLAPRTLDPYWVYTEENVAYGELVIKDTSADMYYLIQETIAGSSGSVSAFVLVRGGDKGETRIPCSSDGTSLKLWETTHANGSLTGATQYLNGESVDSLERDDTAAENQESLSSANWSDTIDETDQTEDGDSSNLDPYWVYTEENVAYGELIIEGTSEDKYYLIQETIAGSTGSVSAFVIVQGSEGGVTRIPCSSDGTSLKLWETTHSNGSLAGATQYLNGESVDSLEREV